MHSSCVELERGMASLPPSCKSISEDRIHLLKYQRSLGKGREIAGITTLVDWDLAQELGVSPVLSAEDRFQGLYKHSNLGRKQGVMKRAL